MSFVIVRVKNLYGVTIPLAGKTGTSQNNADAWFAAYNPKMTIVARVGASSPLIHFNSGSNGTGSALALPIVALTLKKLESDPETREKLVPSYPDLPFELAGALDCLDFKENSFADKILDHFKKKETVFNQDSLKSDRKNGPKTI